ncbi:MAG: NAD(P)H-dependent oxidoreductase [Clostridia bacterium]|nr:NAD(P)H-dependent oxidoreductase [Clostridia bacterium]
MKTLLYVDCCIRREASRTRKMAEAFLGNLPKGWRVEKVTLMDEPLLPLMEGGFRQREELLQKGDFRHRRFDYAWQFQRADAILIAAPFYDLSIPALLKVYIENVSVDGITFLCDEQGMRGNCRASSMTFLTSRGGFYEDSPDEMGSRYMEALCRFFGTGIYRCVAADGLDMDPAKTPAMLADACERAAQAAQEL